MNVCSNAARTAQLFGLLALLVLWTISVHSQTTQVSGLSDRVTVKRDGRGIPYITAANDADLYFVQGYVAASDRLWQMDLMRRLARGQTAEIFGKAGLEGDKRWRRFGFSKIADDTIQYLSPDLRAALENYARGVNAYIATLDAATIPIEFRILQYKPTPWLPTDTIVIGKILSDALSETWQEDVLKASLQSLPKEKFADLTNVVTLYDIVLFGKDAKTAQNAGDRRSMNVSTSELAAAEKDKELRDNSLRKIGLYAEDLAASNNWVVSG